MRTLFKLSWVEIKLFVREPITLVFTFALPVIFLFVMGGVFGNTPDAAYYRGVGAIDYYVPAYFALVIASIGVLALPVHLTGYRERGILRRLRASSISIWSVLGSQVIVSFIIAVLGSILIMIAAWAMYQPHAPVTPALVIPAFFLGAAAFAAIGFLLGAVLPSTRAAQGVGLLLFFVMMILGGAGPPPEALTGAMRTISDFTIIKHVILIIQNPWLGFGWDNTASLVVGGVLVGATLLSARFFRWE